MTKQDLLSAILLNSLRMSSADEPPAAPEAVAFESPLFFGGLSICGGVVSSSRASSLSSGFGASSEGPSTGDVV